MQYCLPPSPMLLTAPFASSLIVPMVNSVLGTRETVYKWQLPLWGKTKETFAVNRKILERRSVQREEGISGALAIASSGAETAQPTTASELTEDLEKG